MCERMAEGGEGLEAEAQALTARLMGNGTLLLLDAGCEGDFESCTQYFKLALQLDAGNLQVAKLLELALALLIDPTDGEFGPNPQLSASKKLL